MIVRRMRPGHGVWGASTVLVLALAGCAPVPPATSTPPPPRSSTPATGAPASPAAPPRSAPRPSSAAIDSTPSAEAERVLATIPEPLGGPAQPIRRTAPAPEAASDTLRATRPSDDDGPVPVPEPTQPMRPAPVQVAPPDTAASRAVASPPSATPPPPVSSPPVTPPASPPAREAPPASTPTQPPATSGSPSGGCWRLQVAAPAERDKAQSRHDAAQSLLLVPMVIERESGLWKVRTRDCMPREAADALRRRATDSGFEGSFVIRATPSR